MFEFARWLGSTSLSTGIVSIPWLALVVLGRWIRFSVNEGLEPDVTRVQDSLKLALQVRAQRFRQL
jgi:hypothetical protein